MNNKPGLDSGGGGSGRPDGGYSSTLANAVSEANSFLAKVNAFDNTLRTQIFVLKTAIDGYIIRISELQKELAAERAKNPGKPDKVHRPAQHNRAY